MTVSYMHLVVRATYHDNCEGGLDIHRAVIAAYLDGDLAHQHARDVQGQVDAVRSQVIGHAAVKPYVVLDPTLDVSEHGASYSVERVPFVTAALAENGLNPWMTREQLVDERIARGAWLEGAMAHAFRKVADG